MPITLDHFARAATALHATGQPALASDYWAMALELAPNDPALLTGHAVTLRALQQPELAERAIRRAVAIDPTARRHAVLGCAIHDQLRFNEAEAEMRRARILDPDSADAAGLLGIWLFERWNWRDTSDDVLSEAISHIERGIALAPDNLSFRSTRLAMLIAAERLEEVVHDATALLGRWPSSVEFHLHRAAALMKLGDLLNGYMEFGEWSYQLPRLGNHPFHSYPKWHPETKPGEVVVWNVEGAGDYFQFIRYARQMAADGWTVRCIANPTMDRLVARVPGVAEVLSEDADIPRGTTMAPLVMLPATYVGEQRAMEWYGPYLSADRAAIAKWRHVSRLPGLRVGICWAGNRQQANDERRSFRTEQLTPLERIPGVTLVSLQKGEQPRTKDEGPRTLELVDLGDEFQTGDWLNTAGLIANLDLVIAPDTGVAHLAGAMGKPVWLALAEPCCWRWMQWRSNSPWYPTMRIFRQQKRGSWYGVFEAMATELQQWATAAA
jgi:tetratricopeptide (TPR) repeat protein